MDHMWWWGFAVGVPVGALGLTVLIGIKIWLGDRPHKLYEKR